MSGLQILFRVPQPNIKLALGRNLGSVAAAALTLGAVSCSLSPPTTSVPPTATEAPIQMGTLTQSPSNCTLDQVNAPTGPGHVSFTAVNETDALVGFDMWLIAEGHSYAELAAVVDEARRNAEAGARDTGPPSYVGGLIQVWLQPGETKVMVGRLRSGTHAIVCNRMFEQVGETRPFGILGPIVVP